MSQYLKEFKERYKGFFKRSRSLIMSSDWHLKGQRGKFDGNTKSFSHENESVLQVVSGLESLIKGAEGERHLKVIQSYINEVVGIIDIHLDRVAKYYLKNDPDKWTHADKKKGEEIFQQAIFKGENKVREKLNKLNISNTYDNLEVVFHSKKIASIPMMDSLILHSFDIKEKIESLDIDWDIILDNEFFINKLKSTIPKYNPKKHFFDQDKDTLQFFCSEWNKIKKGITVDGYFIHPWLYFHLNYFQTAIPTINGEEIMNPPMRDNEWYFAEILKKAEIRRDAGILIYGSRRISKSTLISSYLLWKILISPNGNVSVTAGNDKDLGDLTDKISTALKVMHPAFRVNTNQEDWMKEVEFGLKTTTGEKIKLSDARIINLDAGSKRSSQKTAGGAPVAFVIEEIGKFSWRASFDTAIPSFETMDGWKTIPVLIGTSGESNLSVDAEKVLNNPELNDLMEMDWDLLESIVPKEAITWKRRPFGYFVPAQMAYKKGFKRTKTNLSKFLNIESEDLSKININITDWENNTKVCLERREKLKKDKEKHQKEVVFYPLDPEDCFMSAENNPFPAIIAKKHKERLIAEGNDTVGIAQAITLTRDSKNPNRIISEISNKNVAEFPHQGGFIDAPILLYGELPDEEPAKWTYVASLDDYKHAQSDGDSVGVLTIYKRDLQLSKDDGKVVAILATRPDPHGYFHQQIHLVLEKFNVICFPENEDMKIKDYFDKLGLSHRFLGEGFDVTKKLSFTNTGNRKYGWQPGKTMTPYVIGLVVDYCKKEFEIKDDAGNVVDIRLGVELIDDIYLLDEIIKYRKGGNFDRIISFGGALLYDHYLNITYKYPRKQYTKEQLEKKQNSMRGMMTNSHKKYTKTRRRLL